MKQKQKVIEGKEDMDNAEDEDYTSKAIKENDVTLVLPNDFFMHEIK